MNKPDSTLNDLAESVCKLQHNLKAEVVASILYENGLDPLKTFSNYTSSFNRTYRNDIYSAQYDKEKNILDLLISRNGLYDMLPEGLFHPEIIENDTNTSVKNFTSSYKKQKKEENQARLFFKPFENHLFNFQVDIENKEKSLLNNSHEFRQFFMQFWELESWITDEQFIFLLGVLPYTKQIKGNIKTICQILSHHLKKEITFKKTWIEINSTNDSLQDNLILGQNFVMGNTSDQLPFVEFLIHDISDNEIESYSKGGYFYRFIKLFFEYFLPIELEYNLKVKPNYKQTKSEFGILGHSSILQILKN